MINDGQFTIVQRNFETLVTEIDKNIDIVASVMNLAFLFHENAPNIKK